ncbi:MAG: hypothetical protein ACWGQW_19615 [bacterium]
MPAVTITIQQYDPWADDYLCTQCNQWGILDDFKHCPHCGAELDWQVTYQEKEKANED